MPRRKSRTLTELELDIMQVVWDRGETSVEDIRAALAEHGQSLALPSIRTMLNILEKKGYVTRESESRRHLFRPLVSREEAQRSIVRDLVDRAFGGLAMNLVNALIDTRMVDRRDLKQAEQLVREAEKKEPGK